MKGLQGPRKCLVWATPSATIAAYRSAAIELDTQYDSFRLPQFAGKLQDFILFLGKLWYAKHKLVKFFKQVLTGLWY